MNARTLLIATFAASVAAAQDAAPQPGPSTNAPTRYQLKTKSSFTAAEGARAPFIPIGWVRKDGAVVVVQQTTRIDESAFRVTSILLGNPALAVINGRSYEEGQFLRMPRGSQVRIRVYRIADGQVWLQHNDKLFASPLKRPELGERKVEDPLLNEERDVVPVPMPVPTPAPAPEASPTPAPPQQP